MTSTGRRRNSNKLLTSIGEPKLSLRFMIANANKYQASREAKLQKSNN
jgi:hypothetical protein